MMKRITYLVLLVAIAFGLNSCEKGLLEDINVNPNEPVDVTPEVLLPSTMGYLAYGIGGDVSRFTSMLTQQVTGVTRQWTTYNSYSLSETEMDNWWRFQAYGGAFNDLNILIQKAEAEDLHQYAGIAKTLMAYGIMVTTDMFGDIPYSEAFQGADNLTPAYDSQENVYSSLIALLDEAWTDLDQPAAPISPGADDMIYGGDVDMWKKTARVIQARAYLHLGAVSSANYTNALNALGIEGTDTYGSSAEDALFAFGSGSTTAGPWFQFNDQRGDIAATGYLIDWMVANGDPRLALYADTSDGTMGPLFGQAAASFEFASYVEAKFIEAEAALQSGDAPRAATAHNAAVIEHLAKLGVSDATYEGNFASETGGTITLEKIMVQKYIAMYTNPEAFNDWRRTGFPALTPVPNNVTSGVIPVRLPYPQSERLYNPNVTVTSITTPVWWDQ